MSKITKEVVRHPYDKVKSTPAFSDCASLLQTLREEKSNDFMYLAFPNSKNSLCLRDYREDYEIKPDPNTPIVQRTDIYGILEYEVYAYLVIEAVILLVIFLIILTRLKKRRKKR